MRFAAIYCGVTLLVAVLGQTSEQIKNVNTDLNVYFKSLNQIADFFNIRKYYLNTIAHFGLTVAKVNLKKVLIERGSRLPSSIQVRLKKLVFKMDELLWIAESNAENTFLVRNVISLFNNETLWMSQMPQFHHKKSTSLIYKMKNVKTLYPSWRRYLQSIDPFRGTPTPDQSDACLTNLSTRNSINYSSSMKRCKLPLHCQEMTASGSNNGYGLTHRLLFLQMARYGRRCHVISNTEDRRLRNKFCRLCYSESLYLDSNDFKAFDLFLEQLFLCSLEGHSEFIRRDWLIQMLGHQEREGCFPDLTDGVDLGPLNHDASDLGTFIMLDGRCNGHTTVLAAGVLGAAVRFLLETTY